MATTFSVPQAAAVSAPVEVSPVTYSHLVAGSTAIGPTGQVYRFMGPLGGKGYYVATMSDAVEFLDGIARNPQSQLTRETLEAGAVPVEKVVDPTIALAAADAAAASARAETASVKSAQDKLADIIAANKNAAID